MNRIMLIISFLIFSVDMDAQQVSGTVYDAATNAPLAFVSVSVKNNRMGTVTDIDGKFQLPGLPLPQILSFSRIGYVTSEIAIEHANPMTIRLQSTGKELEAVVIRSGENPAHRIIRAMQHNKKANDPERLPYFTYNAYTVATLSAGNQFWNMSKPDTVKTKRTGLSVRQKQVKDTTTDSMNYELAMRFKENHLIVTESYTERIFRFPNQSKETVLATKISGLKTAHFAITASNFQPFGFYQDNLVMNENSYVNPVANGSIAMYAFRLISTIPRDNDTTYVITFEPRAGKNFNGLKGVMHINSAGYAIENVIASPADEEGLIFTFRVQQKYNRINGHWFPEQLNSKLSQKDLASDSVLLYWDARCYISQVDLDKPVSRKQFSDINLAYHSLSGKRSDSSWAGYRISPLGEKEQKTYETFAMLPAKYTNTIEKLNKLVHVLAIEGISLGKFDLPFKYILSGINRYETFRLGSGLRTNSSFSQRWVAESYLGYGLRDKAWKYGASLQLKVNERTGTNLTVSYCNDLVEPGNVDYFIKNGSVFSSQTLRNFQVSRMDSIRQFKFDFSTRLRPFLQANFWLLDEDRSPAGYAYEFKDEETKSIYRRFQNNEVGLGIRFTRGENFIQMGNAKIRSRPATTQLLAQVARGGRELWRGNFNYTRTAVQLNHNFRLKRLGQTSLQLEAGKTWGQVPYSYLFNTKSSRSDNKLSIFIPYTFQTAGLYEFAADEFAAVFLQHNFDNLLFKPANINVRPEITIVQNISYGNVRDTGSHKFIQFTAPVKGLYETGLLIKNIYRKSIYSICYLGFGGGVFYRYGAYALPKAADNWVFKWGFSITF